VGSISADVFFARFDKGIVISGAAGMGSINLGGIVGSSLSRLGDVAPSFLAWTIFICLSRFFFDEYDFLQWSQTKEEEGSLFLFF